MPRRRLIPIPWSTPAATCRACGAEVYFVTDARTRRPHPVSVACRTSEPPRREVVERDERTGTEFVVAEARDGRGISHFEDCPEAERFRR